MAYLIQSSKPSKLISIGSYRKFCKRSGIDRRLSRNRRQQIIPQIGVFKRPEQRIFIERRFQNERREGWVRTSRWASSFDDITA